MNKIDARGLQCPQPVILTKKALETLKEGEVITIVDNIAARENVSRLATNLNLPFEVMENDGCFHITIKKQETQMVTQVEGGDNIVIVVTADTLGKGDAELGTLLMKSYTYALGEVTPLPKSMLFLNSGVKLACEGAETLENLKKLSDLGVEIICCGTCLDFYGLKDKLRIGIVGNMYSNIEKMHAASSVINIG